MESNITFRPAALEKMLERSGKSTDDEGYILDEDGDRVESNLGNEIKIEDLGGVGNASEVFIEDNFASAAKFAEHKHGIDE
ncbi:hypothetical protein [Natranaeroarchaeum aerophilus]|uniref:Uncharacterized protein n=1 Tax=Natranaeroarchaeum aerophilus TaxID=2917711 RepID=A0AAE3FMY6_9EURY|nr:hypothetical protein [Natranaeroarchaeum aerophilus]MCL9812507.1 hypothetical protein [Natranaeroarchaeum aerophilus]